jgi:hypothetical protein
VSNAFDAMQDAGKADQPIKIQIPNALNDYYFSVRDFGNSMCEETIKNVYMRVNTSTKSKSNTAIGGFGIGSKTPWAYTDTYILTTYLNGLETKYALVKGRSSVQIVYQGETTQKNGTEVIFKVDDNDEKRFAEAIQRISLCAKTKPEINGDMSLDFKEKDIISPSVSIVSSDILDSQTVYINLGGVLYRTDKSMYSDSDSWRGNEAFSSVKSLLSNHATVIISMPIGSVMPLQTREGLFTQGDEGKQNKTMLKRVIKNTLKVIESTMEAREKEVISIEKAIEYFGKGLLASKKIFTFGKINVSSRGFDLVNAGHVSYVTRSSKRWRRGRVKTGRKEVSTFFYFKNIDNNNVYFSEVSPNKARLVSRFHDHSYNQDIWVIEKEKFVDNVAYEFLKKYTKAKDIFTVDIVAKPKAARKAVDKTRVVIHDCYNLRSSQYEIEYFTDKLRVQKTVVVGKDDLLGSDRIALLKELGFDVWKVSPTNVKKLTELNPNVFFTQEQAIDLEKVALLYANYKASQVIDELNSYDNVDFVLNLAPDYKKQLKDSIRIPVRFYSKSDLILKVTEKYGKVIDRLVKKMVRRRVRVNALMEKAPLVQHIRYADSLNGKARTDLENYTKTALEA